MTSSEALRGLRTLIGSTTRSRTLRNRLLLYGGARRAICADCLRTLRQHRSGWEHALGAKAGFSAVPASLRVRAGALRGQAQQAQAGLVERAEERIAKGLKTPMKEYDERVDMGRLRDDEHQRGMGRLQTSIQNLWLRFHCVLQEQLLTVLFRDHSRPRRPPPNALALQTTARPTTARKLP